MNLLKTLAPTPLPLPNVDVETPCFVILEAAIENNLSATAALAGGVDRLVPHVKTHRSPWLTRFMIERGVTAFKAATPREVEMVLAAGASEVIWAYPTNNRPAIERVIAAAYAHPGARVTGLVDNAVGLNAWSGALSSGAHPNISLRVDVDPGMGRTGVAIGDPAVELAQKVADTHRFAGWHVYDGHLNDAERSRREERVLQLLFTLAHLFDRGEQCGLRRDVVGGGSYTFPIWAQHTQARVSPGSWTYSSSQHQAELPDHGWQVGAYVLSTVISSHGDSVTLDAGSKAVAPDMPVDRRFVGVDQILAMKEEHSIVSAKGINPGDRLALVPRHACTTAYLYRQAWVLTQFGNWELRTQLGCER
jgi:3-hydroxy-D-aspartate aldolase